MVVITETNFDLDLCLQKRTKHHPEYYTVRDLKRFLGARKLPTNGKKQELIDRIISYIYGKPFQLDCGGGGNCMFHVLAKIVNEYEYPYTYKNMRSMCAGMVNEDNIDQILEAYNNESIVFSEDFNWSPKRLMNRKPKIKVRMMKNIIKQDGSFFEGDLMCLNLIVKSHVFKKYKIGLVAITNNDMLIKIETSYIPQRYSILYNIDNIHWVVIRSFLNGREKVSFTNEEMDFIINSL